MFSLLNGIKEPKRLGKDASAEEQARYEQDAAQYQQLLKTLDAIARTRNELKKSRHS